MFDDERRAEAEHLLGYAFSNPGLLATALTHPSYSGEHADVDGYDRLEFLGDAVLGFIISARLFELYPNASEGELTRRKHHVVAGESLARIATNLGVARLLMLGRGADAAGDRVRVSVLENTLEALVGALYLDGGLAAAEQFVLSAADPLLHAGDAAAVDPKGALQQYTQAHLGSLPRYEVVSAEGPDHDRLFSVRVIVAGSAVGYGQGRTKQAAEKDAASEALEAITNNAAAPSGSDANRAANGL